MDRQLWKLQLLNNPAILGMALTLASTSATVALEPENAPEIDSFDIELYDETLKKEKAIATLSLSISAEDLTNEDFSETNWPNRLDLDSQEIDEIQRDEKKLEDSKKDEIASLETTEIDETWPEFLTEADIALPSPKAIEEVRETWPEFLSEEDIKRDRTKRNEEAMANKIKVEKTIAIAPDPSFFTDERESFEELARDEVTEETTELVEELTPVTEEPSLENLLDRVNQYSSEPMGQRNLGASQFRDVSPGDWAFQALDDLAWRYDCLKGYPNGTYRGDRPLTRYEFAAGLNACIQQVERMVTAATDFVTLQDLEMIQRLMQEFETELATLSTRVDDLEDRVTFLEAHQFSTTTKLSGEVIFALTDNFDGGSSVTDNILTVVSEMAFGGRARLELNTSFTGRDRLVTRLRAGNLQAYRSGSLSFLNNTSSFAATQTFNVPDSEADNDVLVDWLGYYFQSGNSQAYVAATGGNWSDIAPTLNPYFEDFDGGNGSLSTFAQRNPIFRIGGGAGAAFSLGFNPLKNVSAPSTITLGYFAGDNAATPGAGSGLFNGDYAAMGNLSASLSDRLSLGLTYVHGYHAEGSPIYAQGRSRTSGLDALVGSYAANNPWVLLDNNTGGVPMVTNSYGGAVSVRITDGLIVNGAMTYTNAILLERGNADIWSYSLGIALPDFLKEGGVLALYAGMQPTMKGIRASGLVRDRGRTDPIWHLEGFYRFPLTDNISITPGAVVVFNPNQNFSDHDDAIGTIRFTFSF